MNQNIPISRTAIDKKLTLEAVEVLQRLIQEFFLAQNQISFSKLSLAETMSLSRIRIIDATYVGVPNHLKERAQKTQQDSAKIQFDLLSGHFTYLDVDYKRINDTRMGNERKIIEHMSTLSKNRKEYQVLRSFPAIQDTLACRLIAELRDLTRFENNKKLNAYAGIDIVRYQSRNMEYKDCINKRGNNRLRSIMYFMIVSMLIAKERKINHIVDYYYKLEEQLYDKHREVAVVACMKKILKIAFHLIQHDILYDYETALSHS